MRFILYNFIILLQSLSKDRKREPCAIFSSCLISSSQENAVRILNSSVLLDNKDVMYHFDLSKCCISNCCSLDFFFLIKGLLTCRNRIEKKPVKTRHIKHDQDRTTNFYSLKAIADVYTFY